MDQPLPPETVLHVFAAKTLPKKLTLGLSVQEDDQRIGQARVSFGNVPIR